MAVPRWVHWFSPLQNELPLHFRNDPINLNILARQLTRKNKVNSIYINSFQDLPSLFNLSIVIFRLYLTPSKSWSTPFILFSHSLSQLGPFTFFSFLSHSSHSVNFHSSGRVLGGTSLFLEPQCMLTLSLPALLSRLYCGSQIQHVRAGCTLQVTKNFFIYLTKMTLYHVGKHDACIPACMCRYV